MALTRGLQKGARLSVLPETLTIAEMEIWSPLFADPFANLGRVVSSNGYMGIPVQSCQLSVNLVSLMSIPHSNNVSPGFLHYGLVSVPEKFHTPRLM